MRPSHFLVAAASCFVPLVAHADIMGDTIHATYDFPTSTANVLDFGNVTVPGSGIVPGIATFTFGTNQITITDTSAQNFVGADFNGFVFTDMTKDPRVATLTLDSLSTIRAGQFTSVGNEIFVNFEGIGAVNPGQSLILDLTFAPAAPSSVTPEPSSIALLGTGLLGVVGVMRRRFAQA